MEAQIAEIIGLIRRRPHDLLEFYDLGRKCVAVEEKETWVYAAYLAGSRNSYSFPEYLSSRCAYSRPKISRIMRVARIYTGDTVAECQAKGVGMRILAELAGANCCYRPMLIDYAKKGEPLTTLLRLREIAELTLNTTPFERRRQPEVLQKELADALKLALEEMKSPREVPPAQETNQQKARLAEREAMLARWEKALKRHEISLLAKEEEQKRTAELLDRRTKWLDEREARLMGEVTEQRPPGSCG